jgi:hypothetical protein
VRAEKTQQQFDFFFGTDLNHLAHINLLVPVRREETPAGSRNLVSAVFQDCFVGDMTGDPDPRPDFAAGGVKPGRSELAVQMERRAPCSGTCLLGRLIKRLAFVHGMHGQQLERLISNDLDPTMCNVPNVDARRAVLERDLFAVWSFDGRALKDVDAFLAMMGMPGDGFTRLRLSDADDHLHVGPSDIAPLEFGTTASSAWTEEVSRRSAKPASNFI